MQAYKTRTDVENPVAGEDPNARPTYNEPKTIRDDDLIKRTFAEYATEQGQHARALLKLIHKLKIYTEHFVKSRKTILGRDPTSQLL